MAVGKKKRRLLMRRKRALDPGILIDYKQVDTLKRFITDRGKIIPRRISGATARQQRAITQAVKRARFLSLLPYTVNHKQERGIAHEITMSQRPHQRGGFRDRPQGDRPPRDDRSRDDRSRDDRPREDRPQQAAPAAATEE